MHLDSGYDWSTSTGQSRLQSSSLASSNAAPHSIHRHSIKTTLLKPIQPPAIASKSFGYYVKKSVVSSVLAVIGSEYFILLGKSISSPSNNRDAAIRVVCIVAVFAATHVDDN